MIDQNGDIVEALQEETEEQQADGFYVDVSAQCAR
jgi:hypothetical protein